MGFFGLTTEEAIILAQKYNKADNERNEQRIRAINNQTEEIKKHNKEFLKSEQEKASEISREARQLEPFIILNIFNTCKIMNGKFDETKIYDYDHFGPGGYSYETKRKPYTEIQLWDGRKFKVNESVSEIENKVDEVIERMVNLRARILSETLQNQN